MPLEFDLGTLGATKPTTSSAVQPTTAGQSDLVAGLLQQGNVIQQGESQIRGLTDYIQQLQGAGTSTLQNKIKSPAGLATLLAAIAGGALGGAPGAIGAAAGGVGQMQASARAENEGVAKSITAAMDQIKTLKDELSAARNRIVQVFQANPDAFVDAQTGEPSIPPALLGYYALGINGVSLFPQTKRVLDNRTNMTKTRIERLTGALEKATTKEDARRLSKDLANQMGGLPDDVIEAMTNAYGTPEFEKEFARVLIEYGGQSGIDALESAGLNGLAAHDPKVLAMVTFRDPSATGFSAEARERIALFSRVNKFIQDNPDIADRVRAEAGGDEGVLFQKMAKLAFAGEEGTYNEYMKLMDVPYGNLAREIGQASLLVSKKLATPEAIAALSRVGMTAEELAQTTTQLVLEVLAEKQKIGQEIAAMNDVQLGNDIGARLYTALGLMPQERVDAVERITKRARESATGKDDAEKRRSFIQYARQYTQEFIVAWKAKYPEGRK